MSRMTSCEVIVTPGGARAMRDRVSGEIMHPGDGPLVEPQRLYVTPARLIDRLGTDPATPLVLLDVGLGAGSNAIAAWRASEARDKPGRALEIVSFDHCLHALELALQPAHADALGFDADAIMAATRLLHEQHCTGSWSQWRLCLGDIPTLLAREPAESADIVFWDPFSPRANPALWSVAIFRALRRVCRLGATVHTYSGATATRAALLLAGFAVGFGQPSGHKQKHSTVAAVCVEDLERPLAGSWLDRFAQSTAAWPCDAPADTIERLRALPQFSLCE
jgi:queuine tRNA-ribosyltransferase